MPKTSTSFKKGDPRAGRPPGSPNKLTATVRDTVLSVFQELQGSEEHSLKAFAEKNPRDFYQIAAKLIPTEITGNIKTIINVERPNE